MSLIAVIADVHVANHARFGGPVIEGLNTRCRAVLTALEAAARHAGHVEARALLVLGDLFDTASVDSRYAPQVIAATRRALLAFPGAVYVLVGNHDQVSDRSGDHALGPLHDPEGGITVVERPGRYHAYGTDLWLVPYQAGAARDWLPGVLARLAREEPTVSTVDTPRLLGMHLGIEDEGTPHFLRGAAGSVPVALVQALGCEHNLRAALAGDWHEHRLWRRAKTLVAQCGALVPVGWRDQGFDRVGRMLLVDPARHDLQVLRVPGPRFVDVSCELGLAKARAQAELEACALYVRWRGEGPAPEARGLAALEALPDGTEARAAARTAATVARAATSVEEALAGYVNQMPLPGGVGAEAVLARCRGYLVLR